MPEDGRSAAIFRGMIDAVGDRADEVGPERTISAHWPFVGTQFRGLLVAAQGLDGWDAEVSSGRWRVEEARLPADREHLFRGAQRWARSRPEPISEPMLSSAKRRRAPFWGFSKRLALLTEPDLPGPWLARYAWWNVFPLAWERGSASGILKELQAPLVADLFWAVVEDLRVDRVALVAGKGWWPELRDLLGLTMMTPAPRPLIARGRVRGVAIVATYHPGARMKGVTRDDLAQSAADALNEVR
jgi:hypothetical protein